MIFFPDLETFPTQPGLLVPPMVSTAWLFTSDNVRESSEAELYHARYDRRRVENFIGDLLGARDVQFWGHRIAYDMVVLCNEFPDLMVPIFDKFNDRKVLDVRLRARLQDIRKGTLDYGFKGQGDISKLAGHKVTKYSLEGIAARIVPGFVPYKSDWQLRFRELIDVPVRQWPSGARNYALQDPVVHRDVARALPMPEAREIEETRAAFALHLSAAHGLRVDYEAVKALKKKYRAVVADEADELYELGLLRLKRDGSNSRCMQEIQAFVEQAFEELHGVEAPRTKPSKTFPEGQISTSRGVLTQVAAFPGIGALTKYNQAKTMLSTFIPPVERAGRAGVPLTPSIEPLVNSGRPSCARPNLYNPPKRGGYRPCLIPSKGRKFVVADYEGAELHGFAQTCLDYGIPSRMAEVINAGEDVHLRMTAELLGIKFDKAKKLFAEYNRAKTNGKPASAAAVKVAATRSPLAKAAVFGGLGGLGAMTFIEFCWSWSLFLVLNEAKQALWTLKEAFPEIRIFFEVCDRLTKKNLPFIQARSGFSRGRLRFTQMANTHFQTPIAHGAKDGLWAVTYNAYTVPSSPLYGSRVSLFLYDEIMLDTPEEQTVEVAEELPRIMCTMMDQFVPDVPSKAEAVILDRWRDK